MIGEAAADRKDYLGIMDEIACAGEQHYRTLTEHTPGFLDYFYEATPVREIGLMNIGSRPSHRKQGDRSKDSVRAIGWVFAWGQSRHALPAWYGIGRALEAWRGNDLARLIKLQQMYREWPFFRSLLDNAQMALAKTDMSIAREYAALCVDAGVGKQVYDVIREEYWRGIHQLLNVADTRNPAGKHPRSGRLPEPAQRLPRSAEPDPGLPAAQVAPGGKRGQPLAGTAPALDQRHRGGDAQYRVVTTCYN